MPRNLFSAALAVALGVIATPDHAQAAEGDVLVEFHYQPVPNAQIAIWVEDAAGNFVTDVMVTQATGTLGIGNRPGRWDFLSSWRFPYGPRPQVLPVWAHARGKSYPRLMFHDDNEADLNSLGWHESTSSPEPYFCRPLTDSEHATISTDTMTCPSPSTFQSDKGRFAGAETSVYPPRGDLIEFEDVHDHPDTRMFAELNDLDGISMATPPGYSPELATAVIPVDIANRGPLVARIEINLEDDQNADFSFDREDDHFVDPRLVGYGIGYRGQPSVVYAVEFDPLEVEFTGTDEFQGYGDLDGATGTLHPPDGTISASNGSGADRLQLYTLNGETFRFGVYSHGGDSAGPDDPPDTDDGDDDGPGGDNPGWGSCDPNQGALPAMLDVEMEALDFDQVRIYFTVPQVEDSSELSVRVYYRAGDMELNDQNSSSAIQAVPMGAQCGAAIESGTSTYCDLGELFGNSEYQVGIRYEDDCNNASTMVASEVRTPPQEFATVDGFCFVATAAYGAQWAPDVQTLRAFRDLFLRRSPLGRAFVDMYYQYGPPAARVIATDPYLRKLAGVILTPLVATAKSVAVPLMKMNAPHQ